jgi:iron complex transport system substrate-binding protein
MKKLIPLLLITALFLGACSALTGREPAQPLEITDSTGHTVALEELPDRIAIAGKATVMVQDTIFLFEEALDRVVALENRRQSAYRFLPVVDPGLDDKQFFEMNAGAEQIAAVNPDLVIMKNFMAEQLGEPLAQLDIPVMYLDLENPEAFYQDVETLGKVFGNPERAEEINQFYRSRVEQVQELVPEDAPRPDVLVVEYSEDGGEVAFSVPPVSWLQTRMVELAGGRPIWQELEVSGGWTVITVDQIAAWDPDQIFLIDYQGNASQVAADLREDPIWSGLQAVQNDQLYAFAFDYYSWDQPDTRWILGLQWLAGKIQPQTAAEIDMLEQVEQFYSVMYRLDDETIETEVMPKLRGDIP